MDREPESRTHGDHDDIPPAYAFEEYTVAAPYLELSTAYRLVNTRHDAEELAAVLMDARREQPVVVITSAKDGPWFKPAEVAERLGDDADVYLLANGGVAFDFEDFMPDNTSVYGGAARSYPPGNAWMRATWQSVVRTAYTEAEARDSLARIERDVESMVPLGYQYQASEPAPETAVAAERLPVATGVVSTFVEPDSALVKLEDGTVARVTVPVCGDAFDVSGLLPPGLEVTGTVSNGVLAIEGRNTTPDAADHAAVNTVQLALVASEKTVMLFPGLEVKHRVDAPPGSVVAVLVELAGRADGKAWRLITVEDPEPAGIVPALPFIDGGEPWIVWPAEPAAAAEPAAPIGPAAAEPVGTAAETSPSRAAHDALAAFDAARAALDAVLGENDALRDENRHLNEAVSLLNDEISGAKARPQTGPVPTITPGLHQEVARLNSKIASLSRDKKDILDDQARILRDADRVAAELTELQRANARLREDVRTERERANRARQASQRTVEEPAGAALFADPAEQFRHEVYMEWASRIPASDKAGLRLADYDLAPGFLESVEALQGIDRSKIVAVAVEVLTGLADRLPSRELHRLRGQYGQGQVVDPALGTAWRVSLQVGTASARRMHFWRGAGGRVVFAQVGVHDDMGI